MREALDLWGCAHTAVAAAAAAAEDADAPEEEVAAAADDALAAAAQALEPVPEPLEHLDVWMHSGGDHVALAGWWAYPREPWQRHLARFFAAVHSGAVSEAWFFPGAELAIDGGSGVETQTSGHVVAYGRAGVNPRRPALLTTTLWRSSGLGCST